MAQENKPDYSIKLIADRSYGDNGYLIGELASRIIREKCQLTEARNHTVIGGMIDVYFTGPKGIKFDAESLRAEIESEAKVDFNVRAIKELRVFNKQGVNIADTQGALGRAA